MFESWNSLSALLRDCLNLAAPAVFLAISILNQFVQRSPSLAEKKEQKEMQDLAGKLIDCCAHIGGSCLEQTTWLRRHLAVNADLQQEVVDDDHSGDTGRTSLASQPEDNQNVSEIRRKSMTQYAVPALGLLGTF